MSDKNYWVYQNGDSHRCDEKSVAEMIKDDPSLPVMKVGDSDWKTAKDFGIEPESVPAAEPPPPAPAPATDYVESPEKVTPPVAEAPAPAPAPAEPAPPPTTDGGVPSFIMGTGVDQNMDAGTRKPSSAGTRFWMPKGSSKEIIFLTDGSGPLPYGPPKIFEHNPPIGQGKQRWMNWFTCVESITGKGKCPLCQFAESHNGVGRRYAGMFFSIIDTTEFEDRSGQLRKNTKRLLVAKRDTTELIGRKYLARVEAGEKLRGAMFRVHRSNSDKSPSVGDDYEFMKMVDLKDYPESEPFDYAEMLKPDLAAVNDAVAKLQMEHGEVQSVGPTQGGGAAGPSIQY